MFSEQNFVVNPNISFLLLIFFINTSQTFDNITKTLNITQLSEFTSDYKDVTEHVVINGVEEVGDFAFYLWPLLSYVQIGDSVKTIGMMSFCNCSKLETVEFGANLTEIDARAFYGCQMTQITFPRSLTSIGESAFGSCDKLEIVTFEEGIETIGKSAFSDCFNLINIYIPSSVSSILSSSFENCRSLQFIKVSEENLNFSNYENDGVLYNKNITKLILYPIGNSTKTFHIPNSITSIEQYSFQNCTYIETIFIGENVDKIGADAFSSCFSLKCIYFYGETHPEIASNAFVGIAAKSVMTKETYSNETFGGLNVSKGTTIAECLPWSTQTFTYSNTFSKTFGKSNTFSQSNTFTNSNLFTPSIHLPKHIHMLV